MGVSRSDRPRGRPGKEGVLVTPTYLPAASLIDDATGLRAELPAARFARSAAVPISAPGP
jgi:hypothetical protein